MLSWFIAISFITFGLNFSMGANDESMGSAYGAKSLSLTHAIFLGGFTELIGSVVFGGEVATTVQGKLFSLSAFSGHTTEVMVLVASAVIGASLWLLISSWFALPTSSTHSIVGAIAITAVTARGLDIVQWDVIGNIVLSWVLSPLLGGAVISFLYGAMHYFLLRERKHAYNRSRIAFPYVCFFFLCALGFFCIPKAQVSYWLPYIIVLGCSAFVSICVGVFAVPRIDAKIKSGEDSRYFPCTYTTSETEKLFSYMQIGTASLFSFARGSNDSSHGAGPFALALAVYMDGNAALKGKTREVDMWVLFLGGIAMCLGLFALGRNVIRTVGESLAEITPTNGVASEAATAIAVLIFSSQGIPISSTHTMVGTIYLMEAFRTYVLQKYFMEPPSQEELEQNEREFLAHKEQSQKVTEEKAEIPIETITANEPIEMHPPTQQPQQQEKIATPTTEHEGVQPPTQDDAKEAKTHNTEIQTDGSRWDQFVDRYGQLVSIIAAWIMTIPISGALAALAFVILRESDSSFYPAVPSPAIEATGYLMDAYTYKTCKNASFAPICGTFNYTLNPSAYTVATSLQPMQVASGYILLSNSVKNASLAPKFQQVYSFVEFTSTTMIVELLQNWVGSNNISVRVFGDRRATGSTEIIVKNIQRN
eukprot:PhF_6_TR40515/c1_g1_i3/m.60658/K03306/TC.PIT; inorganic phosphate transporter, PiT family